jgi:hypothetical protein
MKRPLAPIYLLMFGSRTPRRDAQSKKRPRAYVVIVRGRDGHPRFERFTDLAAYRARLLSLERSEHAAISIDEIAGLLDR